MKHYKKLAVFLAGTQLLMALTSCSSNNNSATNSTDSSSTSSAEPSTSVKVEEKTSFDLKNMTDVVLETAGLSANSVLGTAGGRELLAGDVLALVVSELDYAYQMSMYGFGDIAWGQEVDGVAFEYGTLMAAMELALIYQIIFEVAEEEGIAVDDAFYDDVQAYLDSVSEQIGGNDTIYTYVLWQALTTEADFIRNSEANELFNLIYDKYFGANGTKLPDDETIISSMEENGYYRVKHILLSTVDAETGMALDEEAKNEVLAEAERILADLQESDDLENYFHEKMLELSEDPGSIAMPDGYSAYPGQMVPEFENASYELAEYEMSGLVESDFGYHIIYRLPLQADSTAIAELVNELGIEMQDGWLSDNPIETTDLFDQIDLEIFYNNLNVLREQVQPYVDVGDPDYDFSAEESEETEEESEEEVTEEPEAETDEEIDEETDEEE